MSETTSQQRQIWKDFECRPDQMVVIDFGPDRIRVAPPTVEAWSALATVLDAHDYAIRTTDTDSYNCREIKGGGGKSLHSFGIALDVNWQTNPFKETPDNRDVRFSPAPTLVERVEDVRQGRADTDMTRAMIADVLAIASKEGRRVFEWGGNWKSRKDAMHFEIDLSPADLAPGIDWETVKKPLPRPEEVSRGATAAEVEAAARPAAGLSRDGVRAIQMALQRRNYAVGVIDGFYGAATREAVRAFQRDRGLAPTGEADPGTLTALAGPLPDLGTPSISERRDMTTDAAALRAILDLLSRVQPPAAGAAQPAAAPAGLDTGELLRVLRGALVPAPATPSGAAPANAPVPSPTSPTGTEPPVLSSIDQMLGGEALAGKKTLISVVAYVILQLLTIKTGSGAGGLGTSIVDTGSSTYHILSTLITAFGGLGVLSKVDRVTKLLGIMAAKP